MTYLTAKEAADMLGVSLGTLYAYVSRRGIRSIPVEGTRQRLYFESDVRGARRGKGRPRLEAQDDSLETSISLLDTDNLYYRGVEVAKLSDQASLEDVAELLWDAEDGSISSCSPVELPTAAVKVVEAMPGRSGSERAIAVLPLIESESPRAFDLTPEGMAASGARALRLYAALVLQQNGLGPIAIHEAIGRYLELDDGWTDLVRRLMVLSADHALEPSTLAVRTMAGVGISPYRSICAGLLMMGGRRSAMTKSEDIRRFVSDLDRGDVKAMILRRLRGEGKLPGFASPLYPQGDPRALSFFPALSAGVRGDERLQSLLEAIEFVGGELGLKPSFALAVHWMDHRLMPGQRDSLFALGRCVGWIAHSIERYCSGEQSRVPALYTGPLPHGGLREEHEPIAL